MYALIVQSFSCFPYPPRPGFKKQHETRASFPFKSFMINGQLLYPEIAITNLGQGEINGRITSLDCKLSLEFLIQYGTIHGIKEILKFLCQGYLYE